MPWWPFSSDKGSGRQPDKKPAKPGRPPTPWQRVEALFVDGSPEFVPAIRAHADPDDLAKFAATWHADTRPVSRELLHRYLDEPMNAVRHEPLVKRLFKLCEASGDDVTVGRFLVAFDRFVRHRVTVKKRYRFDNVRGWGREVTATEEDIFSSVFDPMPRQKWSVRQVQSGPMKAGKLRLFSTKTRNYLRRRAWRVFPQTRPVGPGPLPPGDHRRPHPVHRRRRGRRRVTCWTTGASSTSCSTTARPCNPGRPGGPSPTGRRSPG